MRTKKKDSNGNTTTYYAIKSCDVWLGSSN